MPCELCERNSTVSIKPIQDLIQKLKNAKKERRRRENQCTRALAKKVKNDSIRAEIDEVRFRIEHIVKPNFQRTMLENFDNRSKKERLHLEKSEVSHKIENIKRKKDRINEY